MNTRVGWVDVAMSGLTMVQPILSRQCHNLDRDIYVTPDGTRTGRAWLWNTLRLILVDSNTRNHAYVHNRAHPGIRHVEGYALLLMDKTNFVDCRSYTTWSFNLERMQRNAKYDSDYEAINGICRGLVVQK